MYIKCTWIISLFESSNVFIQEYWNYHGHIRTSVLCKCMSGIRTNIVTLFYFEIKTAINPILLIQCTMGLNCIHSDTSGCSQFLWYCITSYLISFETNFSSHGDIFQLLIHGFGSRYWWPHIIENLDVNIHRLKVRA